MSSQGTKKSQNYSKTQSSNVPFTPSRKSKDQTKPKVLTPRVAVMFNAMNVTPLTLNPYVFEGGKERQISILDSLTKDTSFLQHAHSLVKVDSQKFHTNILLQRQEMATGTFTRRSTFQSGYYADDMTLPPEVQSKSTFGDDALSFATSVSDDRYIEQHIPEHISLILKETDTIFLLDMPSCTVAKTGEEADDVEEDNKHYEFLTKGKGRNRKVLHVGVQTIPIVKKARDTETKKVKRKNMSTYVSAWEMYDTFKDVERRASSDDSDDIGSLSDADVDLGSEDHMLKEQDSLDSYRMSSEDKQLQKIVRSKAFQDALTVIERILGNNCYNAQQKRFKGLSDPDVFRENIEYKYRLELLWTYANETTEGRCVSGLAFNSCNEDIVAVAYGKYFYIDRNTLGMIMIWNIKNPQQPERQYEFQFPVTSVAFSKTNPNLLAVGFYNGNFKILDVSQRDVTAVREDTTSFEPVWSILWFQQGEDEDLMVSYGDGRVYRYQITTAAELKRTQIMITAAAEGKLKGIKYLKKCEAKEISITGYDQARCLALHPTDPFTYFVGTSEGVVHRCSTNYYNEHMDLYKAHDGAIHTVRYSPFANKMFATCGDDFRSRLWVDGISEPLVTSEPSILPVLDVDWSPVNPTVLATIRGPHVLVWDMQRKMYQSQSDETSPKNVFNTVCRFTSNGRCLLVGDMKGSVRVYSLEDMPIPPFFAENLISHSLKRLLVTRPDLLKKLKRCGSLNFEKQNVTKYFN